MDKSGNDINSKQPLYDALLNEAYFLMRVGRSNPKYFLKTPYSIIFNTIYVPTLSLLVGLACYELITNYQGLESVSDFSKALLVAFQAIVCWITTLLHQNRFARILNQTDHFWYVNECGSENEAVLEKSLKNTKKSMRIFKLMSMIGCVLLLIEPLLGTSGRDLPAYTWKPPGYGKATLALLYSYQRYIYWAFFAQVIGFNVVFVAVMTLLNGQFDMLRVAMAGLNVKNYSTDADTLEFANKLKKYVNHHTFLISYSDNVEKVFAIFLFSQAGNTLFFTSFTLLITVAVSSSIIQIFRCFQDVAIVFFQLGIGCYYGQMLYNKSKDVSSGVYESGWHLNQNKHIRTCVIMVSTMSQKARSLTAFGLFYINFNTMLQVYKYAWSIFTLLRILMKNKNEIV